MYDNLKGVVNAANNSSTADVAFFFRDLLSTGSSMTDLMYRFKRYGGTRREFEKHLKKKVNTQKWLKEENDFMEELNDRFARILLSMNGAHQATAYLLRCCSSIVTVEDILEKSTFLESVENAKMLDSTDKEVYKLFNRLRNVLFHTSVEKAMEALTIEILNEAIDMCAYINDTNKYLVPSSTVKTIKKELSNNGHYGLNTALATLAVK